MICDFSNKNLTQKIPKTWRSEKKQRPDLDIPWTHRLCFDDQCYLSIKMIRSISRTRMILVIKSRESERYATSCKYNEHRFLTLNKFQWKVLLFKRYTIKLRKKKFVSKSNYHIFMKWHNLYKFYEEIELNSIFLSEKTCW